jgi:hypothetical protein
VFESSAAPCSALRVESTATTSPANGRQRAPADRAAFPTAAPRAQPPVSSLRVSTALSRLSHKAGIGHVTAHQLRHTLATQAINRGMSIDAIAALLGHKTLAMTMIYARIADKTVAEEYFNVTEKVEALYGQPRQLPHDQEGSEMRKLCGEMHRRMLGNGHCAPARSIPIATSNRSARAAPSSSPPSSSGPPCKPNETTPTTRDRSADRRSSTTSSSDSTTKRHDPGIDKITRTTTTTDADTAHSATDRQRSTLLAAPTNDRLSHGVDQFSESGQTAYFRNRRSKDEWEPLREPSPSGILLADQ